ncbi:uncharacterized protein LOC103936352 [Pyrus x bretschneideri]|uniref:uncharacterized protein LOC103936352 n=1 Tax=Pyrus x bretschneideri TaxID=225117 RepID=UPI00202F7734|nr:uncharacterized protein LOC103936352 [Pyrus x bretschneideri]
MGRGGGGGRSGSRSGGFRSSRFRSRSSGTSLKSPSAPDEVVVRYSNGGPVRVVRPSDVEGAAFQSNLYSEYDKYGTPSEYLPCEGFEICGCKKLLMSAIETTLFDGCDSPVGLSCRLFLELYCGVEVDIGALKKGSTCSGPVQK